MYLRVHLVYMTVTDTYKKSSVTLLTPDNMYMCYAISFGYICLVKLVKLVLVLVGLKIR